MNKKLQVFKYLTFDLLSAILSWGLLYLYRKQNIELSSIQNFKTILSDPKLYLGLIFVPTFWICLYIITGTYNKIYRKSRLKELSQTMLQTLLGTIIIFFILILDDVVFSYKNYYKSFLFLLITHFTITASFRIILSTITARKIQKEIIGFNTLIIGCNGNAISIYKEIKNQPVSSGNKFIGFVQVTNNNE